MYAACPNATHRELCRPVRELPSIITSHVQLADHRGPCRYQDNSTLVNASQPAITFARIGKYSRTKSSRQDADLISSGQQVHLQQLAVPGQIRQWRRRTDTQDDRHDRPRSRTVGPVSHQQLHCRSLRGSRLLPNPQHRVRSVQHKRAPRPRTTSSRTATSGPATSPTSTARFRGSARTTTATSTCSSGHIRLRRARFPSLRSKRRTRCKISCMTLWPTRHVCRVRDGQNSMPPIQTAGSLLGLERMARRCSWLMEMTWMEHAISRAMCTTPRHERP